MKRLLLLLLLITPVIAGYDDSESSCTGGGYDWLVFSEPNFVSYWRFDECGGSTAYDLLGVNDGSISGAVCAGGKHGYSLSFDGIDDYVGVPYDSSLALNSFTVSAWVYLRSDPGSDSYGVFGTRFNSDYTFDFKVESDRIHGDVGDGSAWLSVNADCYVDIPTYEWHMITYTVNSSAVTIYYDGAYCNSSSYSGTPLLMKSDQELRIGNSHNGVNLEYFYGYIDDVRIYDKDLNSTEVSDVYSSSPNFYAWCCGDDANNDDFYNGSLSLTDYFCYYGVFTHESLDVNQTLCEHYSYDYILGSLTGSGGACCDGDSGEAFYNGSLASTSYSCRDGVYYDELLDVNPSACAAWGYDWLFYSNYSLSSSLSAGNGPVSVDYGDLDGDGDFDVVVSNYYSNSFSVFLNDGSGSFSLINSYSLQGGLRAYDLVLGDVDGDGDLDVVINSPSDSPYSADDSKNYFNVFKNDGSGSFSSPLSFYTALSTNPHNIALGDLDGDGDFDIILDIDATGFKRWINDGSGYYSDALYFDIGAYSDDVALGDVDGDGDLDAVVSTTSDTFTVSLNNGAGSFSLSSTYNTGSDPHSIIVVDLDGDGDLDVVTADYGSNQFSVFLNDGSGSFSLSNTYATGSNPYDVFAVDVDNDDDLDIVTADYGSNQFSVFLNDGSGSFIFESSFSINKPRAIIAGDFNNDYFTDVITADFDDDSISYFAGSPFSGTGGACCGDDGVSDNFYNYSSIGFTNYSCKSGVYYIGSLDFNDSACVAWGFDWVAGSLTGSGGACCGDDSGEDFYNSSIYCHLGSLTSDGDAGIGFCNNLGYEWIINAVGNYSSCCGDDSVADDFYNGSLASTSYSCRDGVYYNESLDVNSSACAAWGFDWVAGSLTGSGGACCGDDSGEDFYNDSSIGSSNGLCYNSVFYNSLDSDEAGCTAYGYSWLSGADDVNGKCCGDDGSLDDFGNTTGSCCCNGVLINSGDTCDLDGDGNIDSKCDNGNLPNVYITDTNINESFVSSDYSPDFLIKNTGNETICINSVSIGNISSNYFITNNPDCIQPGNTGLLSFSFDNFECSDFDTELYPYINITYTKSDGSTGTIINNYHLIVRSSLDITSVNPNSTAIVPLNLNEAGNFLLTVTNHDSEAVNYLINIDYSSNLIVILDDENNHYTAPELSNKIFTLNPHASKAYKLRVVPKTTDEGTVTITFNSTGDCANITDSYTLRVKGVATTKAFFSVSNVSGIDYISVLSLLVITLIVFLIINK